MEILGPKTPVIVAGGASGVGYGTCLALAEHGRPVSVWDIQADAAKATAAECAQRFGVPTDFQVVDLADAEALETSVAATLKTLGGVGGLAYCAGVNAWYEETESFAVISDHHPFAGAEVIDPRDLADLPLHLPDKTDNPDIYHLILEQLADAGVPAPRRAPPLGTFANVIAHVAAGSGWSLSARTLARHVPPGIVARPLATSLRRTVKFEIIWHVNTNTATIEAFTEGLETALVRLGLTP